VGVEVDQSQVREGQALGLCVRGGGSGGDGRAVTEEDPEREWVAGFIGWEGGMWKRQS
jgi:hypothetical protein